jgi:glycosyltransferase involved in cell wall biosynthesis
MPSGGLKGFFFQMAERLCNGDWSRIHFGYPDMSSGPSDVLPAAFGQYLAIDTASRDTRHHVEVASYIRACGIDLVFGFDQPVDRPLYKRMREAGITSFISYWGAPMSSINNPVKRFAKRIEVALRRYGPDHYIFESQGMLDTAVLGRGIPRRRTSVVTLGVDVDDFRPDPADAPHVYQQFGIPAHRKIFFYSGHMEPRKGVAVIMRAANRLADSRRADDWHFCLLGNQNGEEAVYMEMLSREARSHVSFGGYRTDVQLIQRGCYAAVIASAGWDSLTRSAIEMQASGLPVVVSDLDGLREAIMPGMTGLLFRTGDDRELSAKIELLLDDQGLRNRLAAAARERAERDLTVDRQVSALVGIVRAVGSRADH